jgi:hypothetical protein
MFWLSYGHKYKNKGGFSKFLDKNWPKLTYLDNQHTNG